MAENLGLLRMLASGDFADFEIVCQGHVFQVHRAIICARSQYFQAVTKHGFKEGVDRKLVLEEEEPALIARYLIFLYSDSYHSNLRASPDGILAQELSMFLDVEDPYSCEPHDTMKLCLLHAEMHGLSMRMLDEYLTKYTVRNFSSSYFNRRPAYDEHTFKSNAPDAHSCEIYTFRRYARNWKNLKLAFRVTPSLTYRQLYELVQDTTNWSQFKATVTYSEHDDDDPVRPLDHSDNSQVRTIFKGSYSVQVEEKRDVGANGSYTPPTNFMLFARLKRSLRSHLNTEEEDIIRTVYTATAEECRDLRDFVTLDTMYRVKAGMFLHRNESTLLKDVPQFAIDQVTLRPSKECYQCATCLSLQPILLWPCKCSYEQGKACRRCDRDRWKDLRCVLCGGENMHVTDFDFDPAFRKE